VTAGSLTAQAVADLVGGRLLGDGAVRICTVGPLDKAGPDALSFAVSGRYAAIARALDAAIERMKGRRITMNIDGK